MTTGRVYRDVRMIAQLVTSAAPDTRSSYGTPGDPRTTRRTLHTYAGLLIDQHRGRPADLFAVDEHVEVTRCSLAAAAAAPLVNVDEATREHGSVGLETLAGHEDAELIETAQRNQISVGCVGLVCRGAASQRRPPAPRGA